MPSFSIHGFFIISLLYSCCRRTRIPIFMQHATQITMLKILFKWKNIRYKCDSKRYESNQWHRHEPRCTQLVDCGVSIVINGYKEHLFFQSKFFGWPGCFNFLSSKQCFRHIGACVRRSRSIGILSSHFEERLRVWRADCVVFARSDLPASFTFRMRIFGIKLGYRILDLCCSDNSINCPTQWRLRPRWQQITFNVRKWNNPRDLCFTDLNVVTTFR